MKSIKEFASVEVTNLNAIKGGKWKFTGGSTGGHRDDMDINGHMLCSNGDGSYSKCIYA